jgi:hypothetical protein
MEIERPKGYIYQKSRLLLLAILEIAKASSSPKSIVALYESDIKLLLYLFMRKNHHIDQHNRDRQAT